MRRSHRASLSEKTPLRLRVARQHSFTCFGLRGSAPRPGLETHLAKGKEADGSYLLRMLHCWPVRYLRYFSGPSRSQAETNEMKLGGNMNTHGLAETRIECQKVSHEVTIFLRACTLQPWTTSFNPGTTTLERLLELAHEVDFAAFVFAQDDWTTNSPHAVPVPTPGQASPRDNVVFEAGLFCGALGMRRTFILHASGSKLPSDLLGLTSVRYEATTLSEMRVINQKLRKAIENWLARSFVPVRS